MPDAAIYVRLSRDREEQTSTIRQEADCRAWAEAHGYTVATVHADVGLSGYADVSRPGFAAALRELEAGTVEALVVWKLDRLSRRGIGQVGAILDRLEQHGGRIVSVMDGVDTAQAQGRILVALLAELARSESANTAVRVRSAKRHMLERGRWQGGRAPMGYVLRDGRLELDPTTAPVVRELARRATEGQSVRSLAAWLTEAGVRTPEGGAWSTSTVAQILRSPVLVGWHPKGRNGRSGAHTDGMGAPVIVADDPLLTMAERRALLAALDSRTASVNGRRAGRRPAQSLLGGILRCGLCGGTMSSAAAYYRCSAAGQQGAGCRGVSCPKDETEAYVVGAVLRYVAALEVDDDVRQAVEYLWAGDVAAQPVAELMELEGELADVVARLADLEDGRYLRGEFPGPEGAERYGRLRGRLAEQAEGLRAALGRLVVPTPAGLPDDVELLREAWGGAPLALRRSVLLAVLESCVVSKAGRRGRPFEPWSRVSLLFV